MSKPPNTPPTGPQWGQLRSYLARNGFSQEQIDEAIGENIDGRTRGEITAALIEWLRGQDDQ